MFAVFRKIIPTVRKNCWTNAQREMFRVLFATVSVIQATLAFGDSSVEPRGLTSMLQSQCKLVCNRYNNRSNVQICEAAINIMPRLSVYKACNKVRISNLVDF